MVRSNRLILAMVMVFFAVILVCPDLSFSAGNVTADPSVSAGNVNPDAAGGKGGGKPPKYLGVPKTGQTIPYAAGDDGSLQKGVPWPVPRFTDNSNGTVTDNLTGLMWLKDANCIKTHYGDFDNDETPGDGAVTWQHALDFVAGINNGTYSQCGAGYTDWRMSNVKELLSLTDYGQVGPALPNTLGTGHWTEGDPFINVPNNPYWSSTTYVNNPVTAFRVVLHFGTVDIFDKNLYSNYVWPVRGGQ